MVCIDGRSILLTKMSEIKVLFCQNVDRKWLIENYYIENQKIVLAKK